MKVIYLRVPEDIHSKLSSNAKEKDISLSKYVLSILKTNLISPEVKSIDENYKAFTNDVIRILTALNTENTAVIKEATRMLEEIKHLIEVDYE